MAKTGCYGILQIKTFYKPSKYKVHTCRDKLQIGYGHNFNMWYGGSGKELDFRKFVPEVL